MRSCLCLSFSFSSFCLVHFFAGLLSLLLAFVCCFCSAMGDSCSQLFQVHSRSLDLVPRAHATAALLDQLPRAIAGTHPSAHSSSFLPSFADLPASVGSAPPFIAHTTHHFSSFSLISVLCGQLLPILSNHYSVLFSAFLLCRCLFVCLLFVCLFVCCLFVCRCSLSRPAWMLILVLWLRRHLVLS